MKLHDSTIASIAKLIQMAILTGTDIIDHLRMLRLKSGEEDFLFVDEEYQEALDQSINKMLENSKHAFSQETDEH